MPTHAVNAESAPAFDLMVIGLGNTLMGDDGAGVQALRLIDPAALPRDSRLVDGGTHSFSLLEHVESAGMVIFVDALRLGKPPGTVTILEGDELDDFASRGQSQSVHEVSLIDILSLARLRDTMPGHYALVGIEPESFEWGEHLSPAVERGLGRIPAVIGSILDGWRP